MDEYEKNAERKRWRESKRQGKYSGRDLNFFIRNLYFSAPLISAQRDIPIFRIGRYRFFTLTSTLAKHVTGRAFRNCLTNYRRENKIIAITQYDRYYVAAVELLDNSILQIQDFRNCDIDSDKELKKAVEKWMKKLHLTIHPA